MTISHKYDISGCSVTLQVSGESGHLGTCFGSAILVGGHTGVSPGILLVNIVDGQRYVAKVLEGCDPGTDFNWPPILEPVDLHGVVCHGLQPGLKVGDPALLDVHLIFDGCLELWVVIQ